MNDTIEIPGELPPKKKRKPIISILSIVIAAVSMLPMLGIASLLGLLLGIVGIFRERHVTAIIGAVLSAVSLIISPTAWALLASVWLGVYCQVSDCGAIVSKGVQKALENPKNQQIITSIVQNAQSASGSVMYPKEWEKKSFDQMPESTSKSIFAKSSFLMNSYSASPNFTAIFLDGLFQKPADESLDTFIATQNTNLFAAKHPGLKVTVMEPVNINNLASKELNKAQLRAYSDSALATQEVAAYIDGGTYVYVVVISAPNYDEMMKAWPIFSDLLTNRVIFSVEGATPPAPPPATETKPTI